MSVLQQIETRVVAYPVAGHFKFLSGMAERPSVLVKVTDSEGRCGWGQAVPSPTWSYETIETVQSTIDRYLGPISLGQDPLDMESLTTLWNRAIAPSFSTGQPLCKAGLELAIFDLAGRILNQSAAQRWGRRGAATVTLSWTVSAVSLGEVSQTVEQAAARGYRHFNVKVGRDPTFDIALCRELRRLAPEAFIWVDANGGYDLAAALRVAPALAELGIAAFEQPLAANRLQGCRRLRQQGALPVILDEPLVSCADLEEFHALKLLDGVAMKVARCGGLTEAQRMMEFIEREGLLLFASGLTDPDLSFAASLLLLGAYDLRRPAALNAPQFLRGSWLRTPLEVVADQARVPAGPGLGVELDEARLG